MCLNTQRQKHFRYVKITDQQLFNIRFLLYETMVYKHKWSPNVYTDGN